MSNKMIENSPLLIILVSGKDKFASNMLLSRLRTDWQAPSRHIHSIQLSKSEPMMDRFVATVLGPIVALGIEKRILHFNAKNGTHGGSIAHKASPFMLSRRMIMRFFCRWWEIMRVQFLFLTP